MTFEELRDLLICLATGDVDQIYKDERHVGIIKLKTGVEYLPAEKEIPYNGSGMKDVN